MESNVAQPRSSGQKTVHELFEEQAAATPDAVALLFEDQELSYARLNGRANRLAYDLIRLGVARGDRVGLCMERSPEVIVGLLAILKAGGAYVPLDPAYPDERLAFMLGDTAAPLVLAHRPTDRRLAPFARQTRILCLDADAAAASAGPDHNPATGKSAEDLAYVMYTSGSTGTPKGVLIPHRGVVRLVRDTDYCHFGPDEIFLHLAPLAFDASTFEIWGPLLNGGRVAILPPGPPALDVLGATIRRHGVTTLFLTTALFNLAVEKRVEDLRTLRQLLWGGELASPRHVQRALAELQDGRLLHVYGPTECTTFACCFPVMKGHQTEDGIPIGRAIANTTAYVLGEQLQPLPANTPGELFLGGAGLALGYLNNPELTREKFVPNPFSRDPAARLYRTGDRVYLRADGNIVFIGRFDNQVKILGHRIEPGEIEATLRKHPGVRQTVVIPRALPHGEKQLVAYVVAANPGDFSANELKRYLAGRLPPYMVPGHIARLDRLPLNANGKVDRSALPAPDRGGPAEAGPGSPVTEMEEKLAALWGRVLNCSVGLDENFFDLGGTSLELLKVHAELTRMLGRRLPVTDLFEHATVRALAARLAGVGGVDPAMAKAQARAQRQREAFTRQKQLKGSGT
jgi:amino acid adenylation domain-containing protein